MDNLAAVLHGNILRYLIATMVYANERKRNLLGAALEDYGTDVASSQRILQAIASLPERTQAMLALRAAEIPGKEIAARYNLSQYKVSKILRNTIALLQEAAGVVSIEPTSLATLLGFKK